MKTAQWGYVFVAFLAFCFSKILAAVRLNAHFAAIMLYLQHILNLKLYWLGMYYNLFLPGGIGGDGYKAYWLNKHYHTKIKNLVSVLLLDRINGLVALVVLGIVFTLFVDLGWAWINGWTVSIAVVGIYLIHWIVLKKFFPALDRIFVQSHLISLFVQAFQLLCIYFLVKALAVEGSFWAYGLVFLASSIVSVLPLTVGGIGSREIVFLLGSEMLGLHEDTAVAISVMFYMLTAITSLIGGYFAWVSTSIQPYSTNQNV